MQDCVWLHNLGMRAAVESVSETNDKEAEVVLGVSVWRWAATIGPVCVPRKGRFLFIDAEIGNQATGTSVRQPGGR